MKIKNVAIAVALVLVATALTFTVVEIVLRSRTPGSGTDDFLGPAPKNLDVPYVLIPGSQVQFEGHYVKIPATNVAISEQGFRENRVYRTNTDTSTKRIVMLGDSFVFGSGVELEDTFIKQWEQQTKNVEAINMGVPGYNSNHAVELFRERGLNLKPHGVVLFISDNDFYEEGTHRLLERQHSGSSWATERFIQSRLERRKKAANSWKRDPKKVVKSLFHALNTLQKLCSENQVSLKVFLLFPHELGDRILSEHPYVIQLADKKYLQDINSLQIPNDLHPNSEGHKRLALLLAKHLENWPPN